MDGFHRRRFGRHSGAAFTCRRSGVVTLTIMIAFVLASPDRAAAQPPPPIPPGEGDEVAAKLVAEAMRAELDGKGDRRGALLRQAVAASPNYAPARWRLGEVRESGAWRTIDDVGKRWAKDARLTEYRRRREAARDDVAGNLALARFAETNRLDDERRFHLSRLAQLRPGYEEAVKVLGLKKQGNRWMTIDEYLRTQQSLRAKQRAAEEWKPKLVGIVRGLQSNDRAQMSAALAELRAIDDVMAIPSVENSLSLTDRRNPFRPLDEKARTFARDKYFNLEYVAWLAKFTHAEATRALVREAVMSSSVDVRARAAAALAERPWHHFVPQLLAGLVAPIEETVSVTTDWKGRVLYRRSYFREGPLADMVVTYDSFYESLLVATVIYPDDEPRVEGHITPVPDAEVDSLQGDAAAAKSKVARINAGIARLNARIVAALRQSTGEESPTSASQWWRWWQDYNDLFVPEEKPIYERTYAQYYQSTIYDSSLDYNIYSAPTGGGGYGYSRGPCSCFAAGTLVSTRAGPVAIENIRVGDFVLAQDIATGELAYKAVLDRKVRPPAPLLAIRLGTDELRVTRGHPFWVVGDNWQMAKQLEVGDRLHTPDGAIPVSLLAESRPEETFNLVVAEYHNFFVSDRRVLVHDNAPTTPTFNALPGAR